MAKYSFEFKKQIVLEYLSGAGGSDFLAKKHGIPQGKMIRNWVNNYREFGDDGLKRSRGKKNYSFEFKLHVVELYLSSEVSYQELALSQGINNHTLINDWKNKYLPICDTCTAKSECSGFFSTSKSIFQGIHSL